MVLTSDLGAVSFSYPLMKKRQRVHPVSVCRVQGYARYISEEMLTVLYTHQKTKKSKVWQDGILKAAFGGNKIKPGDDFESERYLITVESENVSKTDYNQSKNTEKGKLTSNSLKSLATSSLCHPKRKYSDFQIPRQVEKKKLVEESALPSTSEGPLSSFPHQFYPSSSLFSVPCQNREDAALLTDFKGDPSTKNIKDVEFVKFLASTSLDDEHEIVQNKKCSSSSLPVEYLKPDFQLENALVSSGYHTFSQNIRSRAKIIALLSHDQHVSKRLENETTASLKNLQFTMMQSESNPEVLLQRKSRWDVYMPSCLSEVHNAENNDENINNLQSIEKSLNESECVNRSQSNDHKGIPQMPSWKLDISPVSKDSTGSQPYNFFPSESFMNESSNSELSSLDHANLNCGNALKTFEDSSESSRHGINGNLERSCPGTDFANPGKQFTEVNFNLLNMLDFNGTEDNNPNENSIVSQGSVCLKQEIKNQVEVSGEKNCDIIACNSERKDNVQLEFLQDHDLNRISGSQPLPLCDEISTKPVNIKENNIAIWEKKWQNSEVFINEKVDTNALYQNVDIHQQLPCASRNLIMENDVDCEMHDIKQSFAEAYCPEDVQIPCLHSDSPNLVVEFHGYQVKGSAASKMMTRKGCLYHSKDPQSDMTKSESASKDAFFFLAQELNCPGVPEFVKKMISVTAEPKRLEMNSMFLKKKAVINFVITKTASFKPPSQIVTNSSNLDFAESASGEFNKLLSKQWVSSQTTGCHFFPTPNSKETIEEQELLISKTYPDLYMDNKKHFFSKKGMGDSMYPENDMSILLPTLGTQTPVVPGLTDNLLSDFQLYSSAKICKQIHHHCGFSVVNTYDKSEMLEPEDRMCKILGGEKYIGVRDKVQSTLPNVSEQKEQSKWQKYHNITGCDLRSQNCNEVAMASDIKAESCSGMSLEYRRENQSNVIHKSPLDSEHLETIKSMLCKQQQNFITQDSVSERKKLSLHLNQHFCTEEVLSELGHLNFPNITRDRKDTSELHFPRMDMVKNTNVPKRQQCIPVEFQSPAHYKKVFTTALIEHLNILLFELSKNLHKALGKVDISFYSSVKEGQRENSAPLCSHKIAAKLVMVRKEGRNKGRLFYACDAAKADRCDFFKWLEDVKPVQMESKPCIILHDIKSIGTYLRCQRISIYEECQLLIRKMFDTQRKPFGKMKRCNIAKASFDCDSKRKLFLKLNRKEHSSTYSKDDLWVVSKTLTFEPLDTFIAYSVFFGPSSNNELELEPLNGYSPSNWHSDMIVHALFVCNASTELTNLRNIQENVSSITLPIMQHLLTKKEFFPKTKERKQKFKPPGLSTNAIKSDAFSPEIVINLADKIIQAFQLNKGQATAMMQIGAMMTSQEINTETAKHPTFPITIIHGVFGSGKSLLLAIVILFLTQIFEIHEAANDKRSVPWKILVSSSTNVAVDRILLSLLDIGFEDFIREDLSPVEKMYVKKTIEQHKLGTNKASLRKKYVSIYSFECEKLILVGDPKQLPPTIQGSESAHESGLEQTLFDRLCLMGYAPILLRTQYRCHPVIAAITNELFYEGILLNGISEIDRSPLLDWLPTLCFYNVNGSEQIEADNSFYNMAESFFIVKLIQSLVASGVDGSMIGVITLYKSQMSKIRNLFGAIHMDAAQIKTVQVSTVDAFQGAEKEIIVLSCVRTRQVGFIDSEKRVNVALTRGKRHLLIVGNLNCLRKNKLWGSVIQHCTGRKNGLQHANQCEQQLNDIVKSYFKRKMEEEAIMKKKKSKNESLSQKTNA
ncbi:hypothetical protein L345_03439, partial [Ophiophagus hannah]